MKPEIEVKFLAVDHDDMRKKLQKLGAKCTAPMRLMKRVILDFPDRRLQKGEHNSFVRVRDEGDKITLTFKQFKSRTVDGAYETETIVKSFDDTVNIFTSIGLEVVSFQESKRETWAYGDYEIVLDEWPWLEPYIEIEGESEDGLRSIAVELGLHWVDAVFGGVMRAYRVQYPNTEPHEAIGNMAEVRFGAPPPDFLRS
ncbi:MAG: uncharacterized protein JWL82_26 [Parcubacteria group bacterium]|nr:uncharacterized protein [Parcubacteria group bacterium]